MRALLWAFATTVPSIIRFCYCWCHLFSFTRTYDVRHERLSSFHHHWKKVHYDIQGHVTIHGLLTPNKAFFSLKSRTFGLGQTNWADTFWGIFNIFGRTISTHFVIIFLKDFYDGIVPSKMLFPFPWNPYLKKMW